MCGKVFALMLHPCMPLSLHPFKAQCVGTALWSNESKGVKAASAPREVVADFSWTCGLWFFPR